MGGGSGAHWVLSTPKALTLESPLVDTQYRCEDSSVIVPHHQFSRSGQMTDIGVDGTGTDMFVEVLDVLHKKFLKKT